ncbi:MAG TPA: hypothetical protein ENH87_11185 [Pricia antarctica]|uniref:Uncharacterized protein n=1 Tax=Pricia antarctica TaxID=641691 RepID=A0A831QRQ9_9FLAO|nr:hypothetical protein [Pricia antarctica]
MQKDSENVEAKTEGTEIEPVPGESGLVSLPEDKKSVDDILFLADNIQRVIDAHNKIRMALLRLAQPGDWIVFSDDKDKSKEKAELGFAGAMRIGSTLGVNFTNWSSEKENGTDDNGEWYRWNFECDASYKSRIVRVYGRAASKDKFFGKAYGKFKPLHDIDEGNIKMAGRRGAMKEGIKVLFGLHRMNPTELEKFGVKLDRAGGHMFKGEKEQATAEVKNVIVQIKDITRKVDPKGKWTLYIVKAMDGKDYTTFDKKIADKAKEIGIETKKAKIEYTAGKHGSTIQTIAETE